MTHDEFKKITDQIRNQFWNAQSCYDYFWAFNEQFTENAVDIMLTLHMQELWHETRQAFFTAMMFELTRLYDRSDDTLSIAKWINAGHYLHQSTIPRAEVDQDIATVTEADALVAALIQRRNKGFFHVDLGQAKRGENYGEKWPMKIGECKELLKRAFDLFNKYYCLFFSTSTAACLGVMEANPPTGDVPHMFMWLKKEFDAKGRPPPLP